MLAQLRSVLTILSLITILIALNTAPALALSCAITGGYQNIKGKVVYIVRGRGSNRRIEIPAHNVDLPSFRPLISKISHWNSCMNPYGHDKYHAVYEGKIIQGVKGSSFRKHTKANDQYTDGHVIVVNGKVIGTFGQVRKDLGHGYFQFGKTYFYDDIKLSGPVLKIVKNDYAITRKMVYHRGKPTSYDPQTFEVLGSYLRDKNGMYCSRTARKLDADPATFSIHFLKKSLGGDKDSFFFECKKVEAAKGSYLDLFDHGFLRDERHVYFMKRPIPGLDPASFVLHFQGGNYIQDKNGVYYIRRKNFTKATIQYVKIKEADLETFQATGRSKARDMLALYRKDQRTGENWEGLKHDPNAYFRVHRKRLYRLGTPSPFVNNFQ